MSALLMMVACSCGSYETSPYHTEADVPIDVRPVIASVFGPIDSVELRAGPDAIPITTATTERGGWEWITVIPDAALAPDTAHTLHVVGDFETVDVEFTTGSQSTPAPQVPLLGGLAIARAEIVGGTHSCYGLGVAQAFELTLEADPSAAYHVVTLRHEGSTDIQLNTWSPQYITDGSCSVQLPELGADQTWCVTVAAVSAAGVVSGDSAETCATVESCEVSPDETYDLGETCAATEDPPADEGAGCSASALDGGQPLLLLLSAVPLILRRRRRSIC